MTDPTTFEWTPSTMAQLGASDTVVVTTASSMWTIDYKAMTVTRKRRDTTGMHPYPYRDSPYEFDKLVPITDDFGPRLRVFLAGSDADSIDNPLRTGIIESITSC